MKSQVFRPLTESTVYIGVAALQLSASVMQQSMSTNATFASRFIAKGGTPLIRDRLDRALPTSGVVRDFPWLVFVSLEFPCFCGNQP